jgi:hypothetical protein
MTLMQMASFLTRPTYRQTRSTTLTRTKVLQSRMAAAVGSGLWGLRYLATANEHANMSMSYADDLQCLAVISSGLQRLTRTHSAHWHRDANVEKSHIMLFNPPAAA